MLCTASAGSYLIYECIILHVVTKYLFTDFYSEMIKGEVGRMLLSLNDLESFLEPT